MLFRHFPPKRWKTMKNIFPSSIYKNITFLLVISWLVRAVYVFFLPQDAISIDFHSWNRVAQELSLGNNPYHTTSVLNWPPVWIQIIFVLSKIAAIIDISLTRAIQCFLIVIESLILFVTYICMRRFFPQAPAQKILLFGVSLNPILIYQVCQHGNFDILVGLWIVLFVYFIFSYLDSANPLDWLLACMFLGIGIVTKTIPIILLPLCLLRINALPWKAKYLGLLLIFFPVCLGMGLLYTLTPEDIALKVLSYRSISGWFGITGILAMVPLWGQNLVLIYEKVSSLGLLLFLAYMGIHVVRRPANNKQQLLWLSLLPFLLLITFGSGYGSQYIGWFFPLLMLVYCAEDKNTQAILKMMFVVAIATYTIGYALFPSHGSFLLHSNPSDILQGWGNRFLTRTAVTLVRLPLFYSYVFLFRLDWNRFKG